MVGATYVKHAAVILEQLGDRYQPVVIELVKDSKVGLSMGEGGVQHPGSSLVLIMN